MRRPLCAVCLLFLLGIFVVTGTSPPDPSWDVDACDGKTVTLTGKVADRRIKNESFQVFLEDVSFQTDPETVGRSGAVFPQFSEGIVVSTNDITTASTYVKIGSKLQARGVFAPFELPTCEGQFNTRAYYMIRGYEGQLKRAKLIGVSADNGGLLERMRGFRDRAYEILRENMSEKDAGLVAAMTLGDKTGLDNEIKELYQLAGISHVLALSGLHIASVGLAILALLKRLGLDARLSAVIAGSVIGLYAVMTGLSTSTVRALIMFVLSVISILIGRTYDLLSSAAVSAMLILFETPYYVYDSGFLLSFGAICGIACIFPVLENIPKLLHITFCAVAVRIYEAVCVSLSVMIATLPVMGYSFMQIPVYSVLINLIVIPLMGGVLFTGFFGIFIGLTGLKPRVILQITHYILSFYELLGGTSAKIHGNIILIGQPGKSQIITYVTIEIIAVLSGNLAIGKKLNNRGGSKGIDRIGRQNAPNSARNLTDINNKITYIIERPGDVRTKRRKKLAFLSAFLLLTTVSTVVLSYRSRNEIEIRNVDVGQGDCSILIGRDVPAMMIDGGSTDVKQVAKYRIVPVLKANRISSVEYCFLTHMDSDHVNGVLEMLEDDRSVIHIKNVVISDACINCDPDNDNLKRLITAANKQKVRILTISEGMTLSVGDLKIKCLSPEKTEGASFDANDASIVLLLDTGDGFSGLFTGDISENTEREIMSKLNRVTYLKVAHHGSRTSTCADFLSACDPAVSVISVGEDNSYGHPTPETLSRLERSGTVIYRTDLDGEVIVKYDKGMMRIKAITNRTEAD